MRSSRPVVIAACAVLALAACGDDDPSAGTSAPSSASPDDTAAPAVTTGPDGTMTGNLAGQLDGRAFVSTAVEGYELVEGTRVELTFDGDRLGFSVGCNSGGGSWSVDGDVLVVGAGMAMTEMFCEPQALMDQETWAVELLSSRPTVALDGDTMTLTAAGGEVVTFTDREVADPDRPLEGTAWNVEGFIEADAVSSVALARTPNMVFEGGTVTLDTGCNRGSGSYELTDTDLTFGPIATTRAACADQAGNDAERAVLATLNGTTTYEIYADVLTLRTGDIGLVLRAADQAAGLEGLEGVSWTLDSIVDANTTTAAPELDRPATLSFDGATVSIETGCNGGLRPSSVWWPGRRRRTPTIRTTSSRTSTTASPGPHSSRAT